VRLLDNIRAGRMQKLLSLTAGLSAPPLAFEIYLEHYKGSFGDKWMWAPIVVTPPLTAAGIAGYYSERAARTWLPALSALYVLNGLIGTWTHLRGIQKRPGGFREATYNMVMGPPPLAPGSMCLVGAMGIVAGLVRRER
jgi:hypothetical protein